MINATPHNITVVGGKIIYVSAIRKYIATKDTVVLTTIPPSGILLNAQMSDVKVDTIEVDGIEIETITTAVTSVDELPEGEDFVLVSALYVSARQSLGLNTSRCLTIGTPVYQSEDKPFPMGVMALRRN